MKQAIFYGGAFAVILTIMTVLVVYTQPKPVKLTAADSTAIADSVAKAKTAALADEQRKKNAAAQEQNRQLHELDSLKSTLAQVSQANAQLSEEKKQTQHLAQTQHGKRFEKMTKEMAEIYENMPPPEAAMIISNLKNDVAISVISKMKKRQAAKVMAAMEPFKAIELSQLMTKL